MAVEQIRLIPEPKKRLLWFPIITTIIAAIMALIFHWRWAQPFTTAPIDLPMRKFAFAKNTDMLMFDDATQQRWESLNLANWWKGDWQDESGTKSQKGFHLFHMIHCLTAVRQEFAKLATDETRHITYNARDRNATTQKFHLAHCFDFLRQVTKGVILGS